MNYERVLLDYGFASRRTPGLCFVVLCPLGGLTCTLRGLTCLGGLTCPLGGLYNVSCSVLYVLYLLRCVLVIAI